MYGVQVRAQYFAALVQMPQIAAAVVAAGVAGASLLDRARILLMSRVADIDDAGTREQMGIARMARRHDTVEDVDAAPHRLDDVLRPPHAHQIARLAQRHVGQQLIEHAVTLRLALPHRETSHRETRKADFLE